MDGDDDSRASSALSRKVAAAEAEAERKRAAVEQWRERKAAEAETRAAAEAAARAEEEAEAMRLRQRQRLKREQVALYKLEKEQRARREADIRAVLQGGGAGKGGGGGGGVYGEGGASRYNSAEMRARRQKDMEDAKAKREAVSDSRSAKEAGARQAELAALGKARGEAIKQRVASDPNRALKGTDASQVSQPLSLPLEKKVNTIVDMSWYLFLLSLFCILSFFLSFFSFCFLEQKRAMSQAELDDLEERRSGRKAHSAPVAMGAYDLKFGGRAVPSWRSGV